MGLFSRKPAPETRADTYTDTLVGLLVSQAGGSTVKATATAALEAAAGLVGRAFAAAEVIAPEPVRSALCPLTRSLIGRALIRSGEAVLWADMTGNRIAFRAVADHDITGTYNPNTWTYRLNLPGPSETATRRYVGGDQVLHPRYQVDPERPWAGSRTCRIRGDSRTAIRGVGQRARRRNSRNPRRAATHPRRR